MSSSSSSSSFNEQYEKQENEFILNNFDMLSAWSAVAATVDNIHSLSEKETLNKVYEKMKELLPNVKIPPIEYIQSVFSILEETGTDDMEEVKKKLDQLDQKITEDKKKKSQERAPFNSPMPLPLNPSDATLKKFKETAGDFLIATATQPQQSQTEEEHVPSTPSEVFPAPVFPTLADALPSSSSVYSLKDQLEAGIERLEALSKGETAPSNPVLADLAKSTRNSSKLIRYGTAYTEFGDHLYCRNSGESFCFCGRCGDDRPFKQLEFKDQQTLMKKQGRSLPPELVDSMEEMKSALVARKPPHLTVNENIILERQMAEMDTDKSITDEGLMGTKMKRIKAHKKQSLNALSAADLEKNDEAEDVRIEECKRVEREQKALVLQKINRGNLVLSDPPWDTSSASSQASVVAAVNDLSFSSVDELLEKMEDSQEYVEMDDKQKKIIDDYKKIMNNMAAKGHSVIRLPSCQDMLHAAVEGGFSSSFHFQVPVEGKTNSEWKTSDANCTKYGEADGFKLQFAEDQPKKTDEEAKEQPDLEYSKYLMTVANSNSIQSDIIGLVNPLTYEQWLRHTAMGNHDEEYNNYVKRIEDDNNKRKNNNIDSIWWLPIPYKEWKENGDDRFPEPCVNFTKVLTAPAIKPTPISPTSKSRLLKKFSRCIMCMDPEIEFNTIGDACIHQKYELRHTLWYLEDRATAEPNNAFYARTLKEFKERTPEEVKRDDRIIEWQSQQIEKCEDLNMCDDFEWQEFPPEYPFGWYNIYTLSPTKLESLNRRHIKNGKPACIIWNSNKPFNVVAGIDWIFMNEGCKEYKNLCNQPGFWKSHYKWKEDKLAEIFYNGFTENEAKEDTPMAEASSSSSSAVTEHEKALNDAREQLRKAASLVDILPVYFYHESEDHQDRYTHLIHQSRPIWDFPEEVLITINKLPDMQKTGKNDAIVCFYATAKWLEENPRRSMRYPNCPCGWTQQTVDGPYESIESFSALLRSIEIIESGFSTAQQFVHSETMITAFNYECAFRNKEQIDSIKKDDLKSQVDFFEQHPLYFKKAKLTCLSGVVDLTLEDSRFGPTVYYYSETPSTVSSDPSDYWKPTRMLHSQMFVTPIRNPCSKECPWAPKAGNKRNAKVAEIGLDDNLIGVVTHSYTQNTEFKHQVNGCIFIVSVRKHSLYRVYIPLFMLHSRLYSRLVANYIKLHLVGEGMENALVIPSSTQMGVFLVVSDMTASSAFMICTQTAGEETMGVYRISVDQGISVADIFTATTHNLTNGSIGVMPNWIESGIPGLLLFVGTESNSLYESSREGGYFINKQGVRIGQFHHYIYGSCLYISDIPNSNRYYLHSQYPIKYLVELLTYKCTITVNTCDDRIIRLSLSY